VEGDYITLMMDQIRELHEYSETLEHLPKVAKKPCSLSSHLKNGHSENCLRIYLTMHPLFTKIMGGHPLIISQIASQITINSQKSTSDENRKSFKQLY
jgi:hypothetical protein